jgi:hypothetical protein
MGENNYGHDGNEGPAPDSVRQDVDHEQLLTGNARIMTCASGSVCFLCLRRSLFMC